MNIIEKMKNRLIDSPNKPKIVFAEGWNKTIFDAIKKADKYIHPILLFHSMNEVPKNIKYEHIVIEKTDLSKYSNLLFELRKAKGLTLDEAKQLATQPNYLASLMVKNGDADGEICGKEYSTKDTLKAALQVIKTKPGTPLVTSAFIMEKPGNEKRYIMGDSAININPNPQELAHITKMISIFADDIVGCKNKNVAMLSYSTIGSGKGESAEKVKAAYDLIKNDEELIKRGFSVIGEIQFDAAFDFDVFKQKVKQENNWKQGAQIFVFPNIDAGNIGYKIAQRLGNFLAIGPVLIGLDKPVNDLSRGASVDDIYSLAILTGIQALDAKK